MSNHIIISRPSPGNKTGTGGENPFFIKSSCSFPPGYGTIATDAAKLCGGAPQLRGVLPLELFTWLTSTVWGESLLTLLVSMVPVIELRGGVPFGTALGLAPLHALVVCIIGNMIPIPFIIVFIRRIFLWMRRKSPRLNGLVDRLEKKAHLKGQKVTKYKYIGLWLFVAIPLPGTGAWTGALIAALLDMPLRKAVPSIFLGVVTAGLIMTLATGTVVAIFAP